MDVICNLSLYTVRLYSLFMRLIIYHNDNILRQPSCISFHVMSRSVNVFLLLTRVSERAVVFLRCFVCGTCSIRLFPRGITATHAGVSPLLALELHIVTQHIETWFVSSYSTLFMHNFPYRGQMTPDVNTARDNKLLKIEYGNRFK